GGSITDIVVKLNPNVLSSIACLSKAPTRSITITIIDSRTSTPIAFASVSPFRKCTGESGQLLFQCAPVTTFEATLDIKADGYKRWSHTLHFPADKENISILIDKL